MVRLRDSFNAVLERSYLHEIKELRFHFLFFTALVVVPLLCGFGRPTGFAQLAGSLLNIESVHEVAWIFFFFLVSCWTGMVTVYIVIDLGPRRLVPQPATPEMDAQALQNFDRARRGGRWLRLLLSGVPVLAPFIGMLASSGLAMLLTIVLGLLVAIAVTFFTLWLATIAYYAVLPKNAPDVHLLLPEWTAMGLRGRLAHYSFKGLAAKPWLAGYFDKDGIPYAQHLVMLVLFVILGVIYVGVIVDDSLDLRAATWNPSMPAFSYLELAWLFIGIFLTGLAFFFDGPVSVLGFPVPVLVIVILVIVLNSSLDNFYLLKDADSHADPPLKPEQAINALFPAEKGGDQTLTVVCAAGGGIQAAAWTAQVLTGLDEEFPAFAKSVGLISSVSGGSVGSMYYLHHRFLHNNDALKDDDVVKSSEDASLSAALWGLIGPDSFHFATYLLPIRYSKIDRGWALEQAWRGTPTIVGEQPINENFSDWRAALAQSRLPAVVFNATNVGTGYPALIGTTEIPATENVIQIGDGKDQYGDADIAVVTAARLSASFTYVTPVSTAACEDGGPCSQAPCDKTYLCDGGYFDNPGVWSAVRWLQDALKVQPRRFNKVLVLEIWAFPFEVPANQKSVNQIAAPAAAVLNVRTASQLVRGEIELQMLKALYPDLIDYQTIEIHKPGPLSWMLSQPQKDDIQKYWAEECSSTELQDLKGVYGSVDPKGPCAGKI